MRGLIPLLFGILLVSPIALASNVTVSFHAPPGYVLDDATVHYNASCTGWVVGVFDDGISLQSFALCINRSGEFRLSSYVFPPREKNPPKPYLNTTCPINVSVTPPQYQPDIFPIRLGGESTVGICSRRFGLETLEAAPLE